MPFIKFYLSEKSLKAINFYLVKKLRAFHAKFVMMNIQYKTFVLWNVTTNLVENA